MSLFDTRDPDRNVARHETPCSVGLFFNSRRWSRVAVGSETVGGMFPCHVVHTSCVQLYHVFLQLSIA